jgi:hypothetical protein
MQLIYVSYCTAHLQCVLQTIVTTFGSGRDSSRDQVTTPCHQVCCCVARQCTEGAWNGTGQSTCYRWTDADRVLFNEGFLEPDVCNSGPGRMFTGGNNANYPSCGDCWCCTVAGKRLECVSWLTAKLVTHPLDQGSTAVQSACLVSHALTCSLNWQLLAM